MSTTTISGCSLVAASRSARPSRTMATTSNRGSKIPFNASANIWWSSASNTRVRLKALSPHDLRLNLCPILGSGEGYFGDNFCPRIGLGLDQKLAPDQAKPLAHADQ